MISNFQDTIRIRNYKILNYSKHTPIHKKICRYKYRDIALTQDFEEDKSEFQKSSRQLNLISPK